jgi:hypothetical protein
VSNSALEDRQCLQSLLREASSKVGHKGEVELPTTVAVAFAALVIGVHERERREAQKRERLFEERVPEAAARQLSVVLATSAEEHLATLERMCKLKRPPKLQLKELRERCRQLVLHCAELKVEPIGLRGVQCVRLAAAMGGA